MTIKDRIYKVFAKVRNRHTFSDVCANRLFVVDRANADDGDVELRVDEELMIESVRIENEHEVSVFFDGFRKNALPISKNTYSK